MLIVRILEIVFPVFAIVSIGAIYGRLFHTDMEVANRINMDVFVPALVFSALSKQSFDVATYGQLALGAVVIYSVSGIAAWLLSRAFNIQPKTLVPPMIFRNAGNLGLPVMVLAFGDEVWPVALVLFLVGNLAHFGVGTYILHHKPQVWRMLVQPTIIAAIAALSVGGAGLTVPQVIHLPLHMLGQIAVPLMLFSLGVRLSKVDLDEWRIGLLGGLLSPLLGVAVAAVLLQVLDLPRMHAGALFLFGALPPAVLNFLFAERYAQEPAKVAAIVMFGNVLALLTLSLALAYVLPRYA